VAGLTAQDAEEYIRIALRLASDRDWRNQKSLELKEKSRRYVESLESSNEFQEFIIQAWKRKLAGLPTANWLSGRWE
jgi:predicted O-linked N-acetylglucosamine transferase (SPINDLY family)